MIDLTSQQFGAATEVLTGNLTLADEQGNTVADLRHVMMKRARRAALLGTQNEAREPLYHFGWKAMSEALEAIADKRSFAIIGRGALVGQLVTVLEELGHRAVSATKAQELSEPVEHILYLAGTPDCPADVLGERIAADIEQLRLLVELQDQREGGASISVLTQGVYSSPPPDVSSSLVASASAAIVRVIGKEYPGIRCTSLDLPVDIDEHDSLYLTARVLSGSPQEPVMRISEGAVQALEACALQGLEQPASSIDAQGQYLITGGFGETGQTLMSHLVEAGARYVILTGRSRPSDALLEQVSLLSEKGVHLKLFQGDVAIAEDVASLMRSVQRSGRPLKGIYHLAAVIQDGVLARLDPDVVRQVLEPKVAGTWNLHQATREMALDWFIAFSSVSASIGIAGQSAYVAANAFIEALMRYRHSCGLPGTAIGWGPWSGGMTARLAPAHQEQLRHMGFNFFEPDQVASIALRAHSSCHPTLVAADISLSALRALSGTGSTLKSRPATVSAGLERDSRALDESEKRRAMTQLLIEELAPVVSHGALTLDTELIALGLDSLTAVAIVQRVRQRTGKTLPISAFFDSPTLHDVVEKLLKHF